MLYKNIIIRTDSFKNNLKNRKLSSGGHIMRNTSGHYDTLLTTIEGILEDKRGRTWVDDLKDGNGSKRYDPIKRAVQKPGAYMEHLQPTAVDETLNELTAIL